MFKYRAISFPVLIALLAVMIVWPRWGMYLYAAVAGIAFGMMLYEMGAMVAKIGMPSFVRSTALLGGAMLSLQLYLSAFRYGGAPSMVMLCGVLMLLAMLVLLYAGWVLLLFRGDKKEVLSRALVSSGILLMCGIPIFSLAQVYFTPGLAPIGLFFVMMVTKAMDTGGYVCGMLSGKYLPGGNHKIVPSISPKKSWEGTVGGVVFSVGTSLLFYWLFRAKGIGIYAPAGWYVAAGIVLALGSFAGDLTESALKRACGVKDSGNWIPGMGGAFDVLDSFLYNGILFWLLAVFLR